MNDSAEGLVAHAEPARPERLVSALDYLGRLPLKGPLADLVGSAFSRVRLRAARVELPTTWFEANPMSAFGH